MEFVKKNIPYNIYKILKFLLFFLIIFVLTTSLLYNSIDYHVSVDKNKIRVETLDHVINIQTDSSENAIINFYPQTRYTSPQYLISDNGFFRNALESYKIITVKDNPFQTGFQQSIYSKQHYIHLNPFRSSFQIMQSSNIYRLEVNIPDASLEVWKNNEKLNQYVIKPPWLKLILFPALSSLSLAALIFYLLNYLIQAKKNGRINLGNKESLVENSKSTKYLPILILLVGAFVVGMIFVKVFHTMPGFGDEMNYLIQAKIFAAGKLYVPEPSMPEFFKVDWMDIFGKDGRLWNFQPPGNSIILAIGWIVGVYWITVPIVGGLILAIQFLIARSLLGKNSFAFLHVLIIATSHYFLSLTNSFMAHAPSLLFISLFYLMVIKAIKHRNQKFLVFAGIFLGIAFVIRPLSAVLSAIIPLICLLCFLLRSKEIKTSYLILSILCSIIFASGIFFYSLVVSGKFDLPYMIKGPEAGQTLDVRLQKPWKLTNLYRNYNEFQNRVHSFGYMLNFSLFLIPLFVLFRDRKRFWLLSGYLSFFLYLVLHSFLHWYGWKWEPRMIYDISFIFFLLTSYGIWLLYKDISKFNHLKYLAVVLAFLLIFYLGFNDLPNRFNTEYKNYNFSPYGVKETVSKQKVSNAIIFFKNENLFAPYSPFNNVTFNGNVIYAIDNGKNYNYKLIAKFPKKDVYYSYDAQSLIKSNNFYKEIYKLRGELGKYAQENSTIVIIPWRDTIQSPLDDVLPGKKVSESEFLNLLKEDLFNANNNTMVVFVGNSTNLSSVIARFFKNEAIELTNSYETSIQIRKIGAPIAQSGKKTLGIKMTCYQGINWSGAIIKENVVTTINTDNCYGENRSIRWATTLNVSASKEITFYIESDDGSAIILNGEIVLDNNLYQTHGSIKKTVSTVLKKGDNYLEILYFNGPGDGFINFGVIDSNKNEQPLSVTSLDSFLEIPETPQK